MGSTMTMTRGFNTEASIEPTGLQLIDAGLQSAMENDGEFMFAVGEALDSGRSHVSYLVALLSDKDLSASHPFMAGRLAVDIETPGYEAFKEKLDAAGLQGPGLSVEFGLSNYHVRAGVKLDLSRLDQDFVQRAQAVFVKETTLAPEHKEAIEQQLKEQFSNDESLVSEIDRAKEQQLSNVSHSTMLDITDVPLKQHAAIDKYLQDESPTLQKVRKEMKEKGVHDINWKLEQGYAYYHAVAGVQVVPPVQRPLAKVGATLRALVGR